MKKCSYCGKDFIPHNSQQKYCSKKCQTKARPPRRYEHICDFCGKNYIKKGRNPNKGALKFCSARCKFDYFKKYNTPQRCLVCNELFVPIDARQKCCSRRCRDKLTRFKQDRTCVICGAIFHTYTQTKCCSKECQKKLRAQANYNKIVKGCYTNLITKPTIVINKILEEKNILYINEYKISDYSVDIFLPEYNVCIEIMGKFWHKDIRIFPESTEYLVHKDCVEHDVERYQKIISTGVRILYIWELDINNSIELCKQLIDLFLFKNKTLINAHSSQYILNENNCIATPEIVIKQFMEIQLERLNEKTP